ncbi:MAG: response regulator transcription factor [bacterium]|jgi:DNA-binding response OmpR family regulator
MSQVILVVEDDAAILSGLIDLLEGEGFRVWSARDGKKALSVYTERRPDLILLDIMIPEKSGYDVCKEIRRTDGRTPIIMLTAKGEEVDKVVGLEIGADDYIVKPFSVRELLARIRAALRRASGEPAGAGKRWDDTPIEFADVRIDAGTLKGSKGGAGFSMTLREVQLLKFFVEHDGKVLDRSVILDEVWGLKYEGTTRTLDQHVARLRRKIENDPSSPHHILTVHGVGYRFTSGRR